MERLKRLPQMAWFGESLPDMAVRTVAAVSLGGNLCLRTAWFGCEELG